MERTVKRLEDGSYMAVGKSHPAGESGIIRHSKWENRHRKTAQHEANKREKAANHQAISTRTRHEHRNALRLK